MDGDDYWNTSLNKSFSFDDDIDQKFLDDNVSEISNVSSSGAISLNLIINDSDLQMILEDQMITEPIFPKVSLEEEIKILRRKLQESQYCPIPITINKLLLGKPCSLSIYKSLNEKEDLLDKAILCGNGDAILRIVLFLKNSLKTSLFNQILETRPIAVDHYVNYLNTTMRIGEASEILKIMGRNQEAAMIQFKASVSSKNVITKLEKLKNIRELFDQPCCNPFLSQQLSNFITLLELQINERLYFHPHDIMEKSVIETLYYCCQKFQKWSDPSFNSSTNPFKLAINYAITPSQFEWVAINERGKSQAWRDIEGLFQKKSVIKKKSFTIHIPLELAIIRLYNLRAPQAVLNSFLQHVDDPERRLTLSKKVGAINSIVESLTALKDKQALEDFKETLASGTAEYFYTEKAIINLSNTKSLLGIRKNSNATS
ncbi:CLUMA_CG015191, isoform A [Clunio marinus]|uniref:CLUMA_CG015191, isoform A n=1 Tax=Clunio marinus TaxID=568069 RepID=A0A1J1IPW7_9DIPT|nr:CLUMA_CG015191, isoform A [Clunio marinus]